MNKIVTIAAVCVATFIALPVHAQLLSVSSPTAETTPNKSAASQHDWSFYADRESRVLYIDFEKMTCNLTGIVVKDKENKVIFKDDALWQLPVNTIYEVDFSKYASGEYSVELKSFSNSFKKTVSVL